MSDIELLKRVLEIDSVERAVARCSFGLWREVTARLSEPPKPRKAVLAEFDAEANEPFMVRARALFERISNKPIGGVK